jgi:hypothetical protein
MSLVLPTSLSKDQKLTLFRRYDFITISVPGVSCLWRSRLTPLSTPRVNAIKLFPSIADEDADAK